MFSSHSTTKSEFKGIFPNRNYKNDLIIFYTIKRAWKLTLSVFVLPIESTELVVENLAKWQKLGHGVSWFSKYSQVWCFSGSCPNILVTKWNFHNNQTLSEFPSFSKEIWLSWRSHQQQKDFVASPPVLGTKVSTWVECFRGQPSILRQVQ